MCSHRRVAAAIARVAAAAVVSIILARANAPTSPRRAPSRYGGSLGY